MRMALEQPRKNALFCLEIRDTVVFRFQLVSRLVLPTDYNEVSNKKKKKTYLNRVLANLTHFFFFRFYIVFLFSVRNTRSERWTYFRRRSSSERFHYRASHFRKTATEHTHSCLSIRHSSADNSRHSAKRHVSNWRVVLSRYSVRDLRTALNGSGQTRKYVALWHTRR